MSCVPGHRLYWIHKAIRGAICRVLALRQPQQPSTIIEGFDPASEIRARTSQGLPGVHFKFCDGCHLSDAHAASVFAVIIQDPAPGVFHF